MRNRLVWSAWALALVAAPVLAGVAEDDLSVVKKAVGPRQPAAAAEEAPKASPPEPRKGAEPRWLKLRIQERGAKKAKVALTLPLDLVRALDDDGEDWPVAWRRHKDRKGASLRLGDVLRALDSGHDLVEIEDEEGSVRIWVE